MDFSEIMKKFKVTIFVLLVLVLSNLICWNWSAERNYTSGQIDAANGINQMELSKQPDGQTIWVKKEHQEG